MRTAKSENNQNKNLKIMRKNLKIMRIVKKNLKIIMNRMSEI